MTLRQQSQISILDLRNKQPPSSPSPHSPSHQTLQPLVLAHFLNQAPKAVQFTDQSQPIRPVPVCPVVQVQSFATRAPSPLPAASSPLPECVSIPNASAASTAPRASHVWPFIRSQRESDRTV